MKTAVITDLHANREAVEAVLDSAHTHGAARFVLLGDFVGYGADPVDAVRQLVRQGAVAVMGNHDQAVVRGASPNMRPDARLVVDWTRGQLDPSQLDFLASLPLTQRCGKHFYVHANAWSPAGWDYIQGRADAVRSLHATDCRYTFCGHMHEPKLYNLASTGKAGDFVPTPGVAIPVPAHRQWLVIPGSAGQPRDGNHADHIVLGARGTSALRRLLGSVSSQVVAQVVAQADCTVTVVRSTSAGGAAVAIAAVDEPRPTKAPAA